MIKYRPVVFLAGGEDAVCGGRHFESRPYELGFMVAENIKGKIIPLFFAHNLGEIRRSVENHVRKALGDGDE